MTPVTQWMSWEGGVDVAGLTDPSLPMPNLIFHVARVVHTPVGSAPSGMILWQPDPQSPPAVMGFVSSDPAVCAYFGPHIFAGTPFEQAPVLHAEFDFHFTAQEAHAACKVNNMLLEARFQLQTHASLMQRAPGGMAPFHQQGVEIGVSGVTFQVNGVPQSIILPPIGISGGAAAVYSPNGVYAR